MLINMNQVLQYAEDRRCCIGAFDTPNLETLMTVLGAAEKRNGPVIIQHTQLHECETSIDMIGPIMVRMTKDTQVPVCVMLDHGEGIEYVERALDIGFNAIICDGSFLSYEENVRMTKEVVALARTADANVEAEIRIVTGRGRRESGLKEVNEAYTGPDLATGYVKDAGIDALAASVGTVHDFYTTKLNLNFERIVKIRELIGIPLVMYGGSGISVEDTQKAIRHGIRKINYFSCMSDAGVKAVKKLLEEKEVKYFHDLTKAAVDAMETGVLKAMAMFVLE